MEKNCHILILILFLLGSCQINKEEQIIREGLLSYIKTYTSPYLKTNTFIMVEEIPDKLEHLKIFVMQEGFFSEKDTPESLAETGKPFQYSNHFKLENTDIFLRYAGVPLKDIDERIFWSLYKGGVWFHDPFISVLVFNPHTKIYILIEDGQRYLSIDSLLKESSVRIDSIRCKN